MEHLHLYIKSKSYKVQFNRKCVRVGKHQSLNSVQHFHCKGIISKINILMFAYYNHSRQLKKVYANFSACL